MPLSADSDLRRLNIFDAGRFLLVDVESIRAAALELGLALKIIDGLEFVEYNELARLREPAARLARKTHNAAREAILKKSPESLVTITPPSSPSQIEPRYSSGATTALAGDAE